MLTVKCKVVAFSCDRSQGSVTLQSVDPNNLVTITRTMSEIGYASPKIGDVWNITFSFVSAGP